METLLAALVGGALTIAGGLLVAIATERGERRRWARDAQLKASTELLSALQGLMRRMINVAYLEDKRGAAAAEVLDAYRQATISWNSAMYAALLVSPSEAANRISTLDREVDRLLDQAMSRRWSRLEFREERRRLGRLAAEYLNGARTMAGFNALAIRSVWTWDVDTEQLQAPEDPAHISGSSDP